MKLIENNLKEIEKKETFLNLERKKLKIKLKGLIRLEEEGKIIGKEDIDNYLKEEFTKRGKKPKYIKLSNNTTKYSIQFKLNRIEPIYMAKKKKNCDKCTENHDLKFEGILDCGNQYLKKISKILEKKTFSKNYKELCYLLEKSPEKKRILILNLIIKEIYSSYWKIHFFKEKLNFKKNY